MRVNFGGLGAWGMFVALIAMCALMFTGPDKDSRKNHEDATTAYTWSTELAPPLIVSLVEPTAQELMSGACGYQLALNQKHRAQREEVSATVLLLHKVCSANHCQHFATKQEKDDTGLKRTSLLIGEAVKRNRHNRHRLM